jgi:hypothetical protein
MISNSVSYGDVAYYAAIGREPKINNFDFVVDEQGVHTLIPKVVRFFSML